MTIHRHPDGSYRRYPHLEVPPKPVTPIAGRPNWWRDAKGAEHYVEPRKPAQGSVP